jgi:hypothetical protein
MGKRFISNFFRSGHVVSIFFIGFTNMNLVLAAQCTSNQSTTADCDYLSISSSLPSTTITNAFTINSTSFGGVYQSSSFLLGFTNTGTIISTKYGFADNGVGSNLTNFQNSGTITGGTYFGVGIGGTVTNFVNSVSGVITSSQGGTYAGGVDLNGTIENLNNAGRIVGVHDYAINLSNRGTISNLTNSGTILGGTNDRGGRAGIRVYNTSNSITTLINTGTISGGTGSFGIQNFRGTISNLSNSQNNLTYSGILPANYNIIINSASNYGKLSGTNVTGSTNFGIYPGASITSNLYKGVLQGLTTSNVGATRTGTYDGMSWTLAISSGTSWDLTFVPIAATQESLQISAQRLRSIFNLAAITSSFANMNNYDCNLFDAKGMCISAGGRYTTVDNPNANSTSAVVVIGHKASPNIRIGGFLDQSVNNNIPTGIKVSNKNPLMGVFAVWNKNADGLGVQVKVANAYQDKNINTTRDVIGLSEAGTGSSNLNTQSYVGELSYAFLANQDKTTLRPYLALRHTTIKQDAYEETGVTTPLSYAPLKDRTTAALLGLKLNHALTPKATLTASLGVEQDLVRNVDQYTASGVNGLTPENFNNNIKRTRPIASAGAYFAVSKTQRISGDVYYQQLPFQSTGSITAYLSYVIGL